MSVSSPLIKFDLKYSLNSLQTLAERRDKITDLPLSAIFGCH